MKILILTDGSDPILAAARWAARHARQLNERPQIHLLHVQAPDEAAGAGGPKRYVIAMTIGTERHEFDVVQEGVK